jgi:hypothetical protein
MGALTEFANKSGFLFVGIFCLWSHQGVLLWLLFFFFTWGFDFGER